MIAPPPPDPPTTRPCAATRQEVAAATRVVLCSPTWYRATELRERRASLAATPPDRATNRTVDVGLAARGLCRWRQQPPFTNDSLFDQRLAADGMDTATFLHLLGEPPEAVQERFSYPPSWLCEVVEALSTPSGHPTAHPDLLPGRQQGGFLHLADPLVRRSCERLHHGVQALADSTTCLPFDPDTVEDLLAAGLPDQLLRMMTRTLVLELHVARLQGQLEGETPEDRFTSFVRRLQQPESMLALLQEYPVLARQLALGVDRWVSAALEFLTRLATDWKEIRAAFSPDNDPGVLTSIDGGGDRHKGGRCVLIAHFSSGLRIVYKPRRLSLDIHFQQLLDWINRRSGHLPFHTLRILDRGAHGWVEFIHAAPCPSPAAVRRFYQRQGCYLALLYALEATDFHCENLIAAGEHPVLLDLEALFHPRLPFSPTDDTDRLGQEVLANSVLRVGLLPQRVWSNAQSSGVDMSGLGATSGQLTPFGVPAWQGAGTDEMRLDRERVPMEGSQNRPTLDGEEVDPLDHAEAIAQGFTDMYRFLLGHRDELLAENGPLTPFLDDEVRVVLRGTQTYATLLQESFHPDVLRDALDRTRLFDRLWTATVHQPYLGRVVPAEQHDLLQGDIPLFTTRPGSRDIFTSTDDCIPDLFELPGMELVQRRLNHLSETDLQTQLWMITASLAILAPADVGSLPQVVPARTMRTAGRPVTATRLLTAARAIGDRIESLALRGESGISWIGLTMAQDDNWTLTPVDIGLYDGLAGITLFLAYLGDVTGEQRYHGLAQDVTQTLLRHIERNRSLISSIGGFAGWGGVIYALMHVASVCDNSSLLDRADALLGRLPTLIDQDDRLDIIGGAAGCLAVLLALHRHTGSRHALDLAIRCGNHLIAQAQPVPAGLAWTVPGVGPRPLTGFSHGAAGLAWALLRLAGATGDERFRQTALGGIAYERSLFSPAAGNWPDLRDLPGLRSNDGDGREHMLTAWCHGAPGIGLARLDTVSLLDDHAVRQEIETALQTTLVTGFGGNHSLCHGALGNLELLFQAGGVFDDSRWQKAARQQMATTLTSIERDGWLCGHRLSVESPGLMTGLAGIGYGLLRYAAPDRVPSILLLEPPVRHDSEPTR